MKTIIYDIDDTLYPINRKRNIDLEKRREDFIVCKIGNDPEIVLERIKMIYGDSVDVGLEREYGISKKEYYDNVWSMEPENYMQCDNKLRNIISLISRDFLQICLTSAPDIWARRVLEYLKIYDLFKEIKTCDSGILKPEKRAFLEWKTFELQPSESIAVGNDYDNDLLIPKELGMTTIMVGLTDSRADFSIDEICDIQRILEVIG